jgi:hypothetical protein
MRFKIILLLLFLYILVNKIESYDNQNDLFIFTNLNEEIKRDNIKKKRIRLTKERSKYIYNHLFNINNITNDNNTLKEYLNKIKFVKDNELENLIINKINIYYNLNLDLGMKMDIYFKIIKNKKYDELNYYFKNENLIDKVILNLILNDNNNDQFDVYLINKLLTLNLIKYDIDEINRLLYDINYKLVNFINFKFNKEFSNVIILNLNKLRNLVLIGEINI